MSSRLVRAEEAAAAVPIAWRPANGVPLQTSRTSPSLPGSGSPVLMADLERQTEHRIQAAHQQGFAAGEAASAERASARLEPALSSLNRLVQELAATRKRFRADAEGDTVKLAVAIARRVLHRELATDPEAILGLVKAAFEKLNVRETHRLRVSSSDSATLQEFRSKLELPVSLEILSDVSLAPGSAIFETSRGDLDASVDTQLAEIDRGFADLLRRRMK